MRSFTFIALISFSLLACGLLSSKKQIPVAQLQIPNNQKLYPVKSVVDGDTFWADDGSAKGLKIRLIGIDAPETRRTRQKEIGYYAAESKDHLSQLIGGKAVRLEFDIQRLDRYQRTLAYVFLTDGTFVNAELVRQGSAVLMTTPPNVKYVDQLIQLQQQAKSKKIGLWKEAAPL